MVNCPNCGANLFEPNKAWRRITEMYLAARRTSKVTSDTRIHIDPETEEQLYGLRAHDVGADIVDRIVRNGVQHTLATIFGHQVVWDAKVLEIK